MTAYDKFSSTLKNFSKDKRIQILHRGYTKAYSFKKFNLDVEYNTLEQFGAMLFFFGEKSKHFEIKNQKLKFEINDLSPETLGKIFDLFSEIDTDNIPVPFYEANKDIFTYFNIGNRNIFLEIVELLNEKCKMYLRNYYFSLLHQLANDEYKEISLMVSSSTDYGQAENFAMGPDGIVINFWQWKSTKPPCKFCELPIFSGVPHPIEKEESVLGVIFPHYIYSFKSEGKIFINPNIPDMEDYTITLYAGFDIDQTDFAEKRKIMTSYQTHMENNAGGILEL